MLPQLNTGLNVDPIFLHDNDANGEWFENEQHDLVIFKIFDIEIVHGWLIDPATIRDYKTVKNKIRSFDNYQLLALQDHSNHKASQDSKHASNKDFSKSMQDVSQFLQYYPSQLSDYGLKYLLEYFAHATETGTGNTVKILFRNNHFSTVFYNPLVNQLFTLVTDSSLIDGNLVWQSLLSVNGNLDLFYDENFLPSTSDGTHINNNSASNGTPAVAITDAEDADLKLAQSLQLEEDENLAKQVYQQQQQQQQQRRARQQRQKQQTIGQATGNTSNLNGTRTSLTVNDWKEKKDKKCVIC